MSTSLKPNFGPISPTTIPKRDREKRKIKLERKGKTQAEKVRQRQEVLRTDFITHTTTRQISQTVVTWQGFMCAHVTDGYNESMQTVAVSLSIKLG